MHNEKKLPVYSVSEITTTVLDFLTFLTTLHRNPEDLVMPPPGGWPSYTPEKCAGFKSDFVIEVLKNLPYLEDPTSDHDDSLGHIHYKSHLLDYRTFDRERLTEVEYEYEYEYDDYDYEIDEDAAPDHVFVFAEGFESGGVTLFFDVKKGVVGEAVARMHYNEIDLKKYFIDLKRSLWNLEIFPCPGRAMMELCHNGSNFTDADADRLGEALSEREVLKQTDPSWGTDKDMLYVRYLYRSYGWPRAFRKEEAFREVKELMRKREGY
ncbi:hypothetical protein [Nonomuraea diastatica]|uniref:Uncharacterized protein n=1 Tax=Nonomuraea diastatica TaxID=1848329 RepID=A0A4R4WI73_9ACTN|nr:hypothetical protein [Nonomuraea diastatica]TDD16064.1 hypothetical protein E1294_32675 [Nonomuraea diastatica]